MNKIILCFGIAFLGLAVGQQYVVEQVYFGESCDAGSPTAWSVAVSGYCIPSTGDDGPEYVSESCTDNTTVTASVWKTQKACSGNPDTTESHAVDKCETSSVTNTNWFCSDEIPTFSGNYLIQTRYASPDCSGSSFAMVGAALLGCTGGAKISCEDGNIVSYVCDMDCTNCNQTQTTPDGACQADPDFPGYSLSSSCTSA
eukprot:CAMPEP_0168548924 /NCGR_PEP_ID=MMETSP0413-20121227/4828_1 /TAXON_ID=136452 /ORGANISM="Filamoeba nolandi, Strain NC-AS-23-1" /LENGTH=199 /DNA_ID=CAMNT_0008579275 /DNA_START=110 /DNA_END=706 /DNA_ORIENTATION=-